MFTQQNHRNVPAIRRGVFVLGLLALSAGPLGAQPAPSLFTPVARAASADAAVNPTIVRARYVRVAVDRVASADAQDVAPRVTLNLFDDVTLNAALERVDRTSDGYVWVGRVPEVAMSTVTLATSRGMMYASVLTPAATYIVRPAGRGDYLVTQIDQSAFPAEAHPVPAPASQPAAAARAADVLMADDASTIDVMVLYTPAAAAAASGGISALVDNAISITNTTYANSGVTQRLRLVYSGQVNYTESGDIALDLANMANGSGDFSGVPALRDGYRADLVSLLTQTTNSPYCGVAYKLSSISTSFAPWGYSVVEQWCAVGNMTFPHELGHNMGAGHDWYVDNGLTPQTYAHGFVNPDVGQRWRTVMAYNNLCFDLGFGCGRVAYWANPDLTYNGAAMGVPSGTNSTSSCYFNTTNPVCDADDHRTLNETAIAVANFRQSAAVSVTSLTSNTAFPVAANTPVTWTATGSGGTPPYTWKFYVFNGSTWTVGRDWASSNTWTWTPTTGGTYTIQVWARNAGSSAQYDAWTWATATISVPPLAITGVLQSPQIPPLAGVPATWVVNTAGGVGPHSYKWWIFDGLAWSVVSDWTSATNAMTWTPPAAGTYDMQVWVRNAGSGAVYDVWTSAPRVTVRVPGALTVTRLTSSVASPAPAGTPVTWSARAIGGTVPYTYKFYVFDGTTWTVGQDWSAQSTWTWIPPVSGTYAIQVWIRNAGSAAVYDAWQGVPSFPIGAPTTPTITSFSADRTGAAPAGTPVTWTAATSGGTGPYSYRFYVFNGTTWSIARDWAASNVWTWIPQAAGTYSFQVWQRNTGSAAPYDAWRAAGPMTVTAPAPLSVSSILTWPGAPLVAGGPAIVSASASGGTGPYTYRFWVFNGATWSVGRDWGTSSTWTWTPPAAGTYFFQVWVRNAGSAADYDAWRPYGPVVVNP